MEVKNEMTAVSRCSIEQCAYNRNRKCHAKGITIGDLDNPGCDTYFESTVHSNDQRRMAGVGACKVATCSYNTDFECTAEKIEVGWDDSEVKCLTFEPR